MYIHVVCGLAHRDLKPDNLRLSSDMRDVWLIDFNFAGRLDGQRVLLWPASLVTGAAGLLAATVVLVMLLAVAAIFGGDRATAAAGAVQHSVTVMGPAGTGKTTGFAIPALLEWDGDVVATSVKGDLLEHTIDRRRQLGEVWVYDPTGSTGQPSAGWNPLVGSADWQGALRMAVGAYISSARR